MNSEEVPVGVAHVDARPIFRRPPSLATGPISTFAPARSRITSETRQSLPRRSRGPAGRHSSRSSIRKSLSCQCAGRLKVILLSPK